METGSLDKIITLIPKRKAVSGSASKNALGIAFLEG